MSLKVSVAVIATIIGVYSQFTPGPVKPDCLECICKLESKCLKPIGCRQDGPSLSCGYFQIKKLYYEDCGKPENDWKKCSDEKNCSSACVQAYMTRYIINRKKINCPINCESFAREHYGGPDGCWHKNTMSYWKRLTRIPGCEHLV